MPLVRFSVLCNNKFLSLEKKKVHSSQACLFHWDYKHSQELVVHSSVDIDTMNMLASYLHTFQLRVSSFCLQP